jgi:hypothetical protein
MDGVGLELSLLQRPFFNGVGRKVTLQNVARNIFTYEYGRYSPSPVHERSSHVNTHLALFDMLCYPVHVGHTSRKMDRGQTWTLSVSCTCSHAHCDWLSSKQKRQHALLSSDGGAFYILSYTRVYSLVSDYLVSDVHIVVAHMCNA